MIAALVLFVLMAIGAVVLIRGTIRKTRWGINPTCVACPRCQELLPRVRKPKSMRQAMWGGYSCPACGAEIDKWGRELGS